MRYLPCICILFWAVEISTYYYDNEDYNDPIKDDDYRRRLVQILNDLEDDETEYGLGNQDQMFTKTTEYYDDMDESTLETKLSTLETKLMDKDILKKVFNIELSNISSIPVVSKNISKVSSHGSVNKPSPTEFIITKPTRSTTKKPTISTVSKNKNYELGNYITTPLLVVNLQNTALNNTHNISSSTTNAEEATKKLKISTNNHKNTFSDHNKLTSTLIEEYDEESTKTTSSKKELVATQNYSGFHFVNDISQTITEPEAEYNINTQNQTNSPKEIKYTDNNTLNNILRSYYVSLITATDTYYETDNITDSVDNESFINKTKTESHLEDNLPKHIIPNETTRNYNGGFSGKSDRTDNDISQTITEPEADYNINTQNQTNSPKEIKYTDNNTLNNILRSDYVSLTTATNTYYETDNVTDSVDNESFINKTKTELHLEDNSPKHIIPSEITRNYNGEFPGKSDRTDNVSLIDYASPTDAYESKNDTDSIRYESQHKTKPKPEHKISTKKINYIDDTSTNSLDHVSLVHYTNIGRIYENHDADKVTHTTNNKISTSQRETKPNPNYKMRMVEISNYIDATLTNSLKYSSLVHYINKGRTDNIDYELDNTTDFTDYKKGILQREIKPNPKYKIITENYSIYIDDTPSNSLKYVSLVHDITINGTDAYHDDKNVIDHDNDISEIEIKPDPKHKLNTEQNSKYEDYAASYVSKYALLVHNTTTNRAVEYNDANDRRNFVDHKNDISKLETKSNPKQVDNLSNNLKYVSLMYYMTVRNRADGYHDAESTKNIEQKTTNFRNNNIILNLNENLKLKLKRTKNKFGDYHSMATYSVEDKHDTNTNRAVGYHDADDGRNFVDNENDISKLETKSNPKQVDNLSNNLKYVSLVHYMTVSNRADGYHDAESTKNIEQKTTNFRNNNVFMNLNENIKLKFKSTKNKFGDYHSMATYSVEDKHDTTTYRVVGYHDADNGRNFVDNENDISKLETKSNPKEVDNLSNNLKYVSLVHYMTVSNRADGYHDAESTKNIEQKTTNFRNNNIFMNLNENLKLKFKSTKNKFGDYHSMATYSVEDKHNTTTNRAVGYHDADNRRNFVVNKNDLSKLETKSNPKQVDNLSNNLKYVSLVHYMTVGNRADGYHDAESTKNIEQKTTNFRNNNIFMNLNENKLKLQSIKNKFGDYYSMTTYSVEDKPFTTTQTVRYDYLFNGSKVNVNIINTEKTAKMSDIIKVLSTKYDYETIDITPSETLLTMPSTAQLIAKTWVLKQGIQVSEKPKISSKVSDTFLEIFGPFYKSKTSLRGATIATPIMRTWIERQGNNKTTLATHTPSFDVPALLDIIADFVEEYETNLTDYVNQTLWERKIPTCKTLSLPTQQQQTRLLELDYDVNGTKPGTIVSKCFVCGLDDYGIPIDTSCADSFPGDRITLLPIDHTAKSRLSKFRKNCKYKNTYSVWRNSTDRQSTYGRWTGGCSVRWTDVSTVYTQRSCRNRNRPVMGKHFVSKRMAKLERSLKDTDNGCIISPMAVLTPLSRGISLFARFHACVCAGNYCNGMDGLQHSITLIVVTLITSKLIIILKFD